MLHDGYDDGWFSRVRWSAVETENAAAEVPMSFVMRRKHDKCP